MSLVDRSGFRFTVKSARLSSMWYLFFVRLDVCKSCHDVIVVIVVYVTGTIPGAFGGIIFNNIFNVFVKRKFLLLLLLLL